jgi:hypothetical protein
LYVDALRLATVEKEQWVVVIEEKKWIKMSGWSVSTERREQVADRRINSVGLLFAVNRQLGNFSREYFLTPVIGTLVVEDSFILIHHFLWAERISG